MPPIYCLFQGNFANTLCNLRSAAVMAWDLSKPPRPDFGCKRAAIATQRILAVLRAPSGGGSSASTMGMGVKHLAANVVLASRELGMSSGTENAWRAIKGRDFES
jgi:hypothetical protein